MCSSDLHGIGVRQPSRPLNSGQKAMPYGSRSASNGSAGRRRASGGAVINNTRVCEYKLPKGSYAVTAPNANTKLVQGCSAPIPSGACKTTLAFGLDGKAYASVEVQKK